MEEQLGMHKILWKNAGWGEHHVQNMILYNNQQICEGIRTKLNQKKILRYGKVGESFVIS